MPQNKSMPSTIKRSSKEAQRTWKKTHDSAVEEYGEGRRAHMTAFSSLKHKFEKVGDHWEKKDQKGTSDPKAKSPYKEKGHANKPSYGGVDVEGSTRQELIDKAKKAGVSGYSSMNKHELGKAIEKANNRKTAAARS